MHCLRSIRKLARNQSHSLVMHKGLGFRHLQLLDLLTEAFYISRSIFINNGLSTNDTSQTQKSPLRGKTLWLLLALRFINSQPSHEPPLEGRSHSYIVFDFLGTLSKLECAQCLQCTAAMQGKFDYSFHLSTDHHPGMVPDCKWWLGQNPKADVPSVATVEQLLCERKQMMAAYQLEGLMLAIIVVLEFPPSESCAPNQPIILWRTTLWDFNWS